MDRQSSRGAPMFRRRVVALVVGMVLIGAGCTTVTATGRLRPGLTKAHLVQLSKLGDAHLWLGTTDAADEAGAFDVRVELTNNGAVVAAGLRRCIDNLSSDPAAAKDVAVPWSAVSPATLSVGDVLPL